MFSSRQDQRFDERETTEIFELLDSRTKEVKPLLRKITLPQFGNEIEYFTMDNQPYKPVGVIVGEKWLRENGWVI